MNQEVRATYGFIFRDYQDGLGYPVAKELYNKHVKLLGGSEIAEESVEAEKYLNDIYELFQKQRKETR